MKSRIPVVTVLSVTGLVIVFTFASLLATLNVNVALAQPVAQDVTPGKDVAPVVQEAKPPASLTPDYRSLIGHFGGSRRNAQGLTGNESMIITEVEGNQFKGTYYMSSGQTAKFLNKDVPIQGSISGDPGSEILIFKLAEVIQYELTRSGNKLQGKWDSLTRPGLRFDVLLVKGKN